MGAESSRPAPHRREYAPSSVGDAGSSGPSLWEGVPGPVLSLVQSQVRLLLTQHTSALIHRPESLYLEEDEDDGEEGAEAEGTADGSPSAPKLQSSILAPTDEALAHGALRDRVIGGRLQRALDRLVPSQMSEAAFWDNFFSHVDVIKVRLVTEFLVAREGAAAERTAKHEAWVALYDSMESEMREDVRRAAERIAARQQPRPPSAIELALGLDGQRAPKWTPDGDAWLEYIEDGPDESRLPPLPAPPPAACPAAACTAAHADALLGAPTRTSIPARPLRP